jgi:hypothetical protein
MSSSDNEASPRSDEKNYSDDENNENKRKSTPDLSKLSLEEKNSPESKEKQESSDSEGSDSEEGEEDEDFEEDTETLNTKMTTPLKSTIKEMTANIRGITFYESKYNLN